MTTPCTQEGSIYNISKTLDRMEKGQESIVKLLEKVSNQDVRLDHLEDYVERNYTEIDAILERVRKAEMDIISSGPTVRQQFHDAMEMVSVKLEKINQFFAIATSKPALCIYGAVGAMIVLGTFLDLTCHLSTVSAVIKFFKG